MEKVLETMTITDTSYLASETIRQNGRTECRTLILYSIPETQDFYWHLVESTSDSTSHMTGICGYGWCRVRGSGVFWTEKEFTLERAKALLFRSLSVITDGNSTS